MRAPVLLLLALAAGAAVWLLLADFAPRDPIVIEEGADVESGTAGPDPAGTLGRPARVGVWGEGPSPPLAGASDAWMREPLRFAREGEFTGARVVEALSESLYVRFPSRAVMEEFLAARILPETPPADEPHTKAELRAFLAVAGYGIQQKGAMVMIVPNRQRPEPE